MNAMTTTTHALRSVLFRSFGHDKNVANEERKKEMNTVFRDGAGLDFHNFDFTTLEDVLTLIKPMIENRDRDADYAAFAFRHDLREPLSNFEIRVLAIALLADVTDAESSFGCNDILESTDRLMGKAMNPTTVYKILTNLVDRNLLRDLGRSTDVRTGRVSQKFRISALGRLAFRMAILNAQILETEQLEAA